MPAKAPEPLALKGTEAGKSKVQPYSTHEVVTAAAQQGIWLLLEWQEWFFFFLRIWGAEDLNTLPRLLLNLGSSCISLEFEPSCVVKCIHFFFSYEVVFVCYYWRWGYWD